jgi:hypothetical protein
MTQRDWRVVYAGETELEGTCVLCSTGWRPNSIGFLVDVNSPTWAHLTCSAYQRGNMSSADYLDQVLDRR